VKHHDKRKEFFDRHSSSWDKNYPPETLLRAGRVLRELGIQTGEKVLDLGCGNGVLFPIFRDIIGNSGFLCGLDFSLAMLKISADLTNADFIVCGDASAIPFTDSYFDHIIAFASFPHFADKELVCREANRILKPSGIFSVVHLMSSFDLQNHHKCAGEEVKNDLLPPKNHFMKILAKSGFEDIQIEDIQGKFIMSSKKKV